MKRAAFSEQTLHPNRSPVLFDHFLAQRESQSGTFFIVGTIGGVIGVYRENLFDSLIVHADARIPNGNLPVLTFLLGRNGYHTIFGRELEGVADEVPDDDVDLIAI